MDGLFCAPGHSLDTSRFEIRKSPTGADIICLKSEAKWTEPEKTTPTPTSAVEEMSAAFAKMMVAAPVDAAAAAKPATAAAPAPPKQYKVSELSLEERYASVRLVGEECIQASSAELILPTTGALSSTTGRHGVRTNDDVRKRKWPTSELFTPE